MLLDPTLEAKSECISPTGKHVAFTAEKACLLDDPQTVCRARERRSVFLQAGRPVTLRSGCVSQSGTYGQCDQDSTGYA